MKIAILAHTLFPICEPYAGGMEMITHLLVKQLSERKHQVDLYAVSGSDPSLSIVRYAAKNDTQGGVTGSNDAQEDTSERFECYQLAEAMLKISIGNYDVVHNNTQHYLPVLLGEKLKTPFITTFHIPAFEFLQYAFSYIPRQYNQTFTAVSGHLSTVYERLGIHSRVVYNGVDLNFWEYSNEASENALVWFGRICPEKGTHQAINVAKKMNLKLYLAGPISNEAYYNDRVKPELNDESIIYLGHLDHNSLNTLIGKCRATLFLSTWEEPYGLAIAESLACGTPVVAYNKGAAPEILTPSCGVLVEEHDIKALIAATSYAMGLSRKDCRERAEKFCSIEDMVSAYEQLYAELISQGKEKQLLSS